MSPTRTDPWLHESPLHPRHRLQWRGLCGLTESESDRLCWIRRIAPYWHAMLGRTSSGVKNTSAYMSSGRNPRVVVTAIAASTIAGGPAT